MKWIFEVRSHIQNPEAGPIPLGVFKACLPKEGIVFRDKKILRFELRIWPHHTISLGWFDEAGTENIETGFSQRNFAAILDRLPPELREDSDILERCVTAAISAIKHVWLLGGRSSKDKETKGMSDILVRIHNLWTEFGIAIRGEQLFALLAHP